MSSLTTPQGRTATPGPNTPGPQPRSAVAVRRAHAATAVRWLLSTVAIVVPVFVFSTLITFVLGAASGLN
ncbi:MAG: hypothetical protein JWQ75_1763, partial [Pseudarthrobacter sp.]|nr:hypothetical protein [Pseudarthrobacter sp.]